MNAMPTFKLRLGGAGQAIIFPIYKNSFDHSYSSGLLNSFLERHEPRQRMGERGETTWFYGRGEQPHYLFVGMGEAGQAAAFRLTEAAGAAGRAAEREGLQSAVISFEGLGVRAGIDADEEAFVAAWVEGWLLGTYSFDRYRSKKTHRSVTSIFFEAEGKERLTEAVRLGEIRAQGTMLARDLTNEPSNALTPLKFAERVQEHFEGGAASVAIKTGEELERLGMAGLPAVGRGSINPPVFMDFRYCTDPAIPLTVLIGKGITFDTGGISLKRDNDISDMRMDMAGAAAVIGALSIIAGRGIPANIAVLVAAAENVPDANALLPGEVLRYANGTTVQVGNTDSEGRLVLADALVYAGQIGAKRVVDMATLTYSCGGALGSLLAGIWGDDSLVQSIRTVGEGVGEKLWQLPLVDEYEAYLKSDYADICNISRVGEAGAITSALFLRKFTSPSYKWAHIDMNALKESSDSKGHLVVGATGYGTRLLAEWIASGV
ncbi:leucyl aminopeptidase family protein [Paenibacillus sp. PL91]|uniref:leucyl aminopeptidase family protein n=1 Tax=Paenibacillus sp. PL91 TaxID=2729538 RepID=UPI00145F0CAD|nr:leucyl aminopeptidase family protein [Paenibacillus sp. PL91]MBC9200376.1 leucyl aminopeptidase family protein [Paenibacillus sp. PL91]